MTLVTLHDLRKVAGLLAESPVVGTQAAHLLETAEAASGKADHGPWLTLLVKGSASGFPEVTETEDRDFVYNLIVALFLSVPTQGPTLFSDFLSALSKSSPSSSVEQNVSVLHHLMSLLPTGSSQQKLAFKALVSAPLETKETADLLSPLIPNLQKIISVFTVTEQRELLLFLADKLSALRPVKAYEFHLSYLSLVDASDKDSGVHAKKVLLKALALEAVFNFESLLSLKSVAALKGKDVAYELATVFLGGNVTTYKDFMKKNSSFCQSNALNQDKLTEKFKIMALSSLAAQNLNMSLPYSAIAKAIDVPVSEVEQWIIHAVRSSLIEARMNQQGESVFIVRATALVFGRPQWEALAKRIEAVKAQLTQIQGALTAPMIAV